MHWYARLAELIEDWRFLIRRDGWRSARRVIVQELVRLPYRQMDYLVLARVLTEPLPDLQPKIPLQVREITADDLNLLRQIDRPSEVKLCTRRLARGYDGYLALHEGRPAGHAWSTDQYDPALERVRTPLSPGDVMFADVYTAPAHRGQGVQTTLALVRLERYRTLGYRRAIVCIERQNHASLAVWRRKLGAQIVGEFVFSRVGPWRRVRLCGEPPGA